MKLASFRIAGVDHIGVQREDGNLAIIENIGSMIDMIHLQQGKSALVDAVTLSDHTISPENVKWLPPIPRPGKICGVAMNNSASNERKISAPDHPAFFLKPSSCLIGHEQPIKIRTYYGSAHPEPELAIVIGALTKDIDAAQALQSVFGYTIFNDITGNGMRADDLFHYWALYADPNDSTKLVRREQHLSYAARYKGSDTFGCMGPYLVTADEVADPDNLQVTCSVAGEVVAEDNTYYYNYKVAELVSYISQFMTLEPGDVISCGTAFKPSKDRKSIHNANFLQVSGPVEVTIGGLGTLINGVEVDDREIGQWRMN